VYFIALWAEHMVGVFVPKPPCIRTQSIMVGSSILPVCCPEKAMVFRAAKPD